MATPRPTGFLKRKRSTRASPGKTQTDLLSSMPVDLISLIATYLDPRTLSCTLDRLCRVLRGALDETRVWLTHFENDFGVFQMSEVWLQQPTNPRDLYAKAYSKISGFRLPMDSPIIQRTRSQSEVVYLNSVIKLDELDLLGTDEGIYVELTVHAICDNMSFCLVDFDGDGCSSLTFSPDAGAIIRERKREDDGALFGAFTAALPPCKDFGTGKKSRVALFISREQHITFMRFFGERWESTGPISGFEWVEGGLLTPCVAFREAGEYIISIEKVCHAKIPKHAERLRTQLVWKPLVWLMDEVEDDDELSEVEDIDQGD